MEKPMPPDQPRRPLKNQNEGSQHPAEKVVKLARSKIFAENDPIGLISTIGDESPPSQSSATTPKQTDDMLSLGDAMHQSDELLKEAKAPSEAPKVQRSQGKGEPDIDLRKLHPELTLTGHLEDAPPAVDVTPSAQRKVPRKTTRRLKPPPPKSSGKLAELASWIKSFF